MLLWNYYNQHELKAGQVSGPKDLPAVTHLAQVLCPALVSRHTRPPLFPNGLTLQVYKLQTLFVSKEEGQYVKKSGYQGNSAGEPPDARAPIKKTVLLFVPATGSFLQALDTHFLPSVLSP